MQPIWKKVGELSKLEQLNLLERPLGSPSRLWENNIIMDLKEIEINAKNWVDSAKDRDYCCTLLNAELNLRVL